MKKKRKPQEKKKRNEKENDKRTRKTRRGKPKPRPKDIFNMDSHSQPKKQKKQKKNVKSRFEQVISAEYLEWLEFTAMCSGYDTLAARAYFDDISNDMDFRQDAAEWFGDVKYTFGFDIGWFDFQRRWS